MIMAQIRVYYAMAQDGMFPQNLEKQNEEGTNYIAANLICTISLLISIFFELNF